MTDFLDVALARLKKMPRSQLLEKLKEYKFDYIDIKNMDVFSVVKSKENGVVLIQPFTPKTKINYEEFSTEGFPANDYCYQISEAA